jgi:tetratricopeptide (TPR) repeat protein
LPAGISTRAERDSLFAAAMPTPTRVNRVGLLCLDLSKVFARARDWDRSEEWARRGLYVGVESLRPNLYLALAVPLFRQGHRDSAEFYAALSVKEAPKSAPPRLYHGALLTSLGRYEEALGEYLQAYSLSNGDPAMLNDIAQSLSQLGRYEEAVQTLNRVPPAHPQRAMARRNAAVLLLARLDRPEEALEALRESIQLDPNQEGADRVRAEIEILEAARKR